MKLKLKTGVTKTILLYVKLIEDLGYKKEDYLEFIKHNVVTIENNIKQDLKSISAELFEQLIADKFLDGINKEELK